MASERSGRVTKTPGWWQVTDHTGDVGFYKFREDGRAHMIGSRFWDWCYTQGEWEPVTHPAFLGWADRFPEPTAVFGEPGFLEALRADRERATPPDGAPQEASE